ncbi:MAG: site-specific DNA-methyltransferase [Candidatus Omnitrophica bacterium]|nr:site-specific DNA-methyltransferase [Candidatus Omnitrophota bacterium]
MKYYNDSENFKGKRMIARAKDVNTSWAYRKDENFKKGSLVLLDNVQFIYELALAQLELHSLGINFQVTNGLREFKLLNSVKLDELIKRSAYFKMVDGKYTNYFRIIQKNNTRSVNQYLTHWIYPYKGKFHPQMIRALLNIIGLKEGDTVLDPFIGSGTTAVESQLLGINCIGIDISPLCVLQSRVKTESIEVINEINKIKESILNKSKPSFFKQENESFLEFINDISNEKVRNFYKMAYLVAVSDNARRGKDFEQSFYKNLDLMIKSVTDFHDIVQELKLKLGKVTIEIGDSKNLPIKNESVDGIITSPPYSIALDYVSNDAHALKVLGLELSNIREKFIGVRGRGSERINLYNQDMEKSYDEMYRVLKPQKFVVIVIGNATYMGEEVKTVEFTINYCQKIGFKLIKNIDKIIFGLYNVMQKENILIFQKI